MRIAIIGSGYVGLVAGACFADTGNTVYCVDKDEAKVNALREGIIPIYEPGLETLVRRSTAEGRMIFTTDTAEAVKNTEIIFMAVGTPSLPSGEPDLSFLKAAAEEVARAMNGPKLVVNKSTVPIGSHRLVAEWMSKHTEQPFDVISNPEFLKEGSAVDDFLKPDRVVIGTESERAYKMMADLYAPFVRQGNPVLWMDPMSAEITKYACNAFLATRISFMNELAQLCETAGGDVEKVRKGMTTDVRIGKHFLYPGVGYGGSCFPKDVQALMSTGRKMDLPMRIVTATEEANKAQKHHLAKKVKAHFGGKLQGRRFGIWGLAFKPNTDDMREAPSLTIIEDLLQEGASVQAYDPVSNENARKILGDRIQYRDNLYDAAKGVDAVILVTEWNEFRHPELERIARSMKSPVLFDGRNVFDPSKMKALGFQYFGVGRA